MLEKRAELKELPDNAASRLSAICFCGDAFFCSRGGLAHGRPRYLIGIYRIAALLSKEDGSSLVNLTCRDTPRAGGQA